MISIRQYLLRALVQALIVGSLLTSVLVYWNASIEIDELYNKSMEEVANLLHSDVVVIKQGTASAGDRSTKTSLKGEEEMLIQLWSPAGELINSSYPAIPLALQANVGKSIAHFQHDSWYVYRTGVGKNIIQIAQTHRARKRFVREMALDILYPIVAQIPIIGLFIWLAIGKSMGPFSQVTRAIHERSAKSMAPLEDTEIPHEIKPMVQELNALLARLDTALATQKQFTMDAAHELRTPLAAIKLQLGNLDRADPSQQKDALDKLHRGIDRASHVVKQLLTLARLEPETTSLTYSRVDVSALVGAAVEAYAEIAFAKHVDLGLARTEPSYAVGNADALRIVVDNLIDNAIRYTAAGGKVDVAVYMHTDGAIIKIADNGIGIPIEKRARLFERFYRIIGTESDGTGLGLAIVKHIVDKHRGEILITTGIEGEGTAFVVKLPLAN
ncbi:MAG: sensor histidine kinase [Rickettsiales bacterium]